MDIRQNSVKKLNSILKNKTLAETIEESVYNHTCELAQSRNLKQDFDIINFKRLYVNKLLSLYVNLNKKSYVNNQNLLSRIKKGNIDVTKIAWMKPQELFPEKWKELIERKEASEEFMYLKKHEIETNIFKCDKCKERRCTYYQAQKKKSDEPMTTFITCMNCGNKWQQND